jgi:ABC-type uncharacterized transport system auxiliary subunit
LKSNRAMKSIAIFSLALAVLCACETTGDPHQGGIFWSENKAQERLYQKREQLRQIESDTDRAEGSSRRAKSQLQDDEG